MKARNATLITVTAIAFLLSFGAIATVKQNNHAEQSKGGKGFIALISAFSPELDAIKAEIKAHPEGRLDKTIAHRGVKFYLGKIADQPVVVFTTGISIANAAMTTQMAIDFLPIKKIIMMGIAGAAREGLMPGDLAVPKRWYYHDESIYAKPVPDKPGTFHLPDIFSSLEGENKTKNDPHRPDYQYFDYLYPNDVWVVKKGWQAPRRKAYFDVTQSMLQEAVVLAKHMPAIKLSSGEQVKINIGGHGASGSVFVDNPDYRDWVSRTFSADVVDMESTAVGQVCFINDIDWLVIRSVSDLAGAQSGENTARLYNSLAAGSAAKFAIALVDALNAEQ